MRQQVSKKSRLNDMGSVLLYRCVSVLALTLGVGLGELARGAETDLIEVRLHDTLFFHNGDVETGRVFDLGNEYRITKTTGASRQVNKSEVRQHLERQTPESALEKLARNAPPATVLRLAREVRRRFPRLRPRVAELLAQECETSRNPELLACLTELYLDLNRTAEALKTAQRLVVAAPAQPRALLLRGLAYQATGQLSEAAADLERAYNQAPEDPDIMVARATLLCMTARAPEARRIYETALARNPANFAALLGQGLMQLRLGEIKAAEQSLQQALNRERSSTAARLGLAAVLLLQGDYDECYRECDRVLNLDNRCAEAYALQAQARLFSADGSGLTVFQSKINEALKEKEDQPRALLTCAVGLERMAQYEEMLKADEGPSPAARALREAAAAKYAEVLASDAPDSYIQYFRGEHKFRAQDYTGAEAAFQQAARLAPHYAPAHAALGAAALLERKSDLALEAYRQAIALEPATAEYHAGLGLAFLRAKKFELANENFRKALELDPREVTALCGQGYIANFEKNKTSALKFFQQALLADGSCAYAANALAQIYAQDDMTLEYVAFDQDFVPSHWRTRAGGSVRAVPSGGQLLFSGTQGTATGGKLEFSRDLPGDEFVRLEADLQVSPRSPISCGLRLATGSTSAAALEIELGKDESNEIKLRYPDPRGGTGAWQALKLPWPEGRVRLGIEADDLKEGRVRLWVNGENVAKVDLGPQRMTRITVGVFVQAAAREAVHVSVDNIALLLKGGGASREGPDPVTIIKKEESAPPAP